MYKNLLFSSVGDNTLFYNFYIGNNMNYDVYIIYYGNNPINFEKYKQKVTFIKSRKGSKFQNFKYFYDTYLDIINKYDYFFILDDDIIIDVSKINSMFHIANYFNLSICSPSFKSKGKISHKVTKYRSKRFLTYTNFIEVGVPLFNKISLHKFMKFLYTKLIGWGIDYLYIWSNGLKKNNKYAIIHCINCINPHDNNKKIKVREHYLINNQKREKQIWINYSIKINCPNTYVLKEYYTVLKKHINYKTKNNNLYIEIIS